VAGGGLARILLPATVRREAWTPATCGYRVALWETHPVTRIEVLRNNPWMELNDH
jgi:hypothetical protein